MLTINGRERVKARKESKETRSRIRAFSHTLQHFIINTTVVR